MDEGHSQDGHTSSVTLHSKRKRSASSQAAISGTSTDRYRNRNTHPRRRMRVAPEDSNHVELKSKGSSIHEEDVSKFSFDLLVTGEASTPYKYLPLDETAHEIRLLTILPGGFSSEVRVCLHPVSFPASKDSDLEFEALSYTWGSQDNLVDLLIGESGSRTIKITQNLSEALPYLRYDDIPRIFWIDAICVNQQYPEERSSQVRRMADIYSLASRVVVWLGLAAKDTALAVECCKEVSENIIVDWTRQTLEPTPLSKLPQWADTDEVHSWNPEQEIAVTNLLKRSWFYRLWIWQEVALASATLVMCGSFCLSWKDIQDTVFALFCKPEKDAGAELREHMSHLLSLCRRSSIEIDINSLLYDTKDALCSDPRDKLFALFSLLRAGDQYLATEVDYTKSTSQIYMEFARNYVKVTKRLDILCHVEMVMNSATPHRPTWVPNWSSARQTDNLRNFKASGNSAPSADFGEGGSIQLVGCKFGTIDCLEYFGSLAQQAFSDENILKVSKVLKNVKDQFGLESDGIRSLCRVLCSREYTNPSEPLRDDYTSRQYFEGCVRKVWDNGDESELVHLLNDHHKISPALQITCHRRSLFKCLDGTLGLAPAAARPGDIVVVWLGCNNPMVLRPSMNGIGRYLLVGEAYCDGLMFGEAILGSLPSHFECVQVRGEEGHYYWVYIDRRSDEIQWEDPRLSDVPLPEPWRMRPHQNRPAYINDETREWTTDRDPRMSREELEKRGVELEVFEVE